MDFTLMMHVFVYMCILHLHFAHVNMGTFFFLFIKSHGIYQLAAVTKELQLDVKWGLDGVSASHSLLEKTAIAVLMDTITTQTAFVSLVLLSHAKLDVRAIMHLAQMC